MVDIQQNAPLVYISFSAQIDATTTETLLGVLSECANKKVKEVYLLLSTPGGSVMHGLTLYNMLKGMPFELTTHNAGNVDSIGNMIFLAGKKRYSCSGATFMFHGVGVTLNQNTRLEEKDLRGYSDNISNNNKRIGTVIAERSKLTGNNIDSLFAQATTMTAQDAFVAGIVHEIREINILPNCPIVTLVFKR